MNNFDWADTPFKSKGNATPWIPEATIFLTRHGSHAYGTNIPGSDLDLRGIAIPPKRYLLGFSQGFDQAELKDPDLVIFGIHKFFSLAADCNPNALEILFTDPEDHLVVAAPMVRLLDRKDKFLSKKVRHTFAGYAKSQRGRIERHYRWLKDPPSAPPRREDFSLPPKPEIPEDQLKAALSMIQKQLDSWSVDFVDHFDRGVRISIVNHMADYLASIQIGSDEQFAAAARIIGFNENFIYLCQREKEFRAKQREWQDYQEWKRTRNPQRAALEANYGYDCKHGMHLCRLYRTCSEILLTGKMNVRRPDAEELIAIRHGAWSYEKLMEYADQQEIVVNEAMKVSKLPSDVNKKELDDLCISIIEEVL